MRRWAMTAAVLAVAVAGCETKGTISGKVTYKDKPVTTGTVTAISGDGVPRTGTIGTDGAYTIPDVLSGEVKFAVSSSNPDLGARAAAQPRRRGGEGDLEPPPAAPAEKSTWVPLPDKYADPAKSELSQTVKGDAVVNLELK